MTKFGFILVFSLLLYACDQVNSSHSIHESLGVEYDSATIAILNFESAREALPRDAKPSSLTQADLYTIDHLLKPVVEDWNVEMDTLYEVTRRSDPLDHPQRDWFVIDLREFKRQYIPFVNRYGEREVLVICIKARSIRNLDWQTSPIPSNYGGHHAFRVRLNLTKAILVDFQSHGYG